MERIKEWDENVTRMDAERLVEISRDDILAGGRSSGRPMRRWNDLTAIKTCGTAYNKKEKNIVLLLVHY